MLIKDLIRNKDLENYKRVYFIDYNSNFNSAFFLETKEKNETLFILSPNLNLEISDLEFINNSNLNFWIFDWNFFKGEYYKRWLSHNKSFKNINKKNNFIFKYFFEILYKHSLNSFFLKNKLIEDQKIIEDKYILYFLKKKKIKINKARKSYLNILFYYLKKKIFIIGKITVYNLLLVKNTSIKFTINKKKKLLAIRHYSDGFNLSKNNTDKCIDWMVDKNKINFKNTIIVSEEPHNFSNLYKKSNYQVINLNVLDMRNLNANIYYMIKSFIALLINIFCLPYFIFSSLKSNELYFKLLSSYFKWNIFVKNFEIGSYLSYHDYKDVHILRNIILRQNLCQTIHYKHTNSENIFDQKNINIYNNVNLAFSNYDIENHWTKFSLSMSKKNLSKSLNLIISGPIDYKSKFIKKKNKTKIIAIFTSSLNKIGVVNSFNAHYRFLLFVKTLLKKKKYIVYLKPKYNLNLERKKNKQLNLIFKDLVNYKNFHIYDKNSLDLIKNSDLTISMPFSSTTIEALSHNKPAIYLDILNSFPNNSYNQIKNFVFNSEKKLFSKLYYLLNSQQNIKLAKKIIFGNSISVLESNQIIRQQILNEK